MVGIPDEMLGENVLAIIVLRDQTASTVSSDIDLFQANPSKTLNHYLDDKLAHYKRPKHVVIVSSIPRNHMGKVRTPSLLE